MTARMRGILATVLVAAMVLLGYTTTCLAAVSIEVLSTTKEAAPGTFVTHVFAVANSSAISETYELVFAAPAGWGVLGAPATVSVESQEEETLFVTLTIPAEAAAGSYSLALTATSSGNASDQATGEVQTSVTSVNEVAIVPPVERSLAPGSTADYAFTLINQGNAQETLEIEASSSRGFPLEISQTLVELAPQERYTITIQIAIPVEAEPGRDVLILNATSNLHAGVEERTEVFTTILPPAPEAVGGTLMEQLPARLRLSIDKNVITGLFDSNLSFSVSGRVLDGYFSSFVNASDPLGPDPVSVGSYSMLYRLEPVTYAIGNVSARPTDLIALSCEGASVVVDGEFFDVTLIGGGTQTDTRYAGALALGPEQASVGFTYMDMRTDLARRAVWGATAGVEPLDGWTMRLEGALGLDGPLTSRAFFFNTTIDVDGYFLSGEVFSIGSYFPGSMSDSAGILLSQRLRVDDLSLSVSLGHEWDNVVGDPLETTTINDELGFNIVTTPFEDGPTVTSTFEFEWTREPNLGDRSDIDMLASFGFSETGGVFPYAFSGKAADRIDHVLGTHSRTWSFREGVGLSIDSFYLFLQLSQERHVDLVTDTILSSSSDISFLFRPEGAVHEASINLRNNHDTFDLSASLFIQMTEDLDVVFDGSIEWDRADAEQVEFGWGIALNASFEIPLPFLRTKGRVEGRLFVDMNGNGVFDEHDRPVNGAIISADRSEVSTNGDGYFRFYPFYPGTYTLDASQLPIDAALTAMPDVDVQAGETLWVNLPLAPVTVITGVLFEDANQDEAQQPDEGGFEQIRILLSDASGDIADTLTTPSGSFSFVDLLPGDYTVSVDRGALPDRFAFTTPGDATVTATADQTAEVSFGGIIRPRDVIITFQPPTADFIVEPESPTAGEPVSFDGTFSFDFDGEILLYAWDFDGDGETDSDEPVAEYVFPIAGEVPVSLTVTDDGGNVDTVIFTIQVQPGSSPPEAIAPTSDDSTPSSTGDAASSDQESQDSTESTDGTGTFQPPIADFAYSPDQPVINRPVFFDGSISLDPDGEIATFEWDFDGDGVTDANGASIAQTFSAPGELPVRLLVKDNEGNSDSITLTVTILAQAPVDSSSSTIQPPIADFSYSPDQPMAETPIEFDASLSADPDGDTLSYAWDFDADGETDATEVMATHVFADPGDHVVALSVTDGEGNTDTIIAVLSVAADGSPETAAPGTFQPPIADFSYVPAQPEVGEAVTFDGTLSFDFDGEIVSYAWDFNGDGEIDTTEDVAVFAFENFGPHDVSLTVTDDAGSTDTITYTLEIAELGPTPGQTLQPPIADFSYSPAQPETGIPVSFDGTLSFDFDGRVTAYAWDFDNDGLIDASDSIAYHVFASPGSYPVRLTVTDNGGNSDTVEYALLVEGEAMETSTPAPPPASSPTYLPPIADFSYMPQAPLAGELVMFNASDSFDPDGTIVAYAWDFNEDGIIDATEAISVTTFPVPAEVEVRLTVTDNDGNTDTFAERLSIE